MPFFGKVCPKCVYKDTLLLFIFRLQKKFTEDKRDFHSSQTSKQRYSFLICKTFGVPYFSFPVIHDFENF